MKVDQFARLIAEKNYNQFSKQTDKIEAFFNAKLIHAEIEALLQARTIHIANARELKRIILSGGEGDATDPGLTFVTDTFLEKVMASIKKMEKVEPAPEQDSDSESESDQNQSQSQKSPKSPPRKNQYSPRFHVLSPKKHLPEASDDDYYDDEKAPDTLDM